MGEGYLLIPNVYEWIGMNYVFSKVSWFVNYWWALHDWVDMKMCNVMLILVLSRIAMMCMVHDIHEMVKFFELFYDFGYVLL